MYIHIYTYTYTYIEGGDGGEGDGVVCRWLGGAQLGTGKVLTQSVHELGWVTRVAAPSPRASLGRRTVCGRTEPLSAAGFEALRN